MTETANKDAIEAADKFYSALLEYLGLPSEKSPENAVKAAFGAVEFACVVATQVGVPEDQFKKMVDAIWSGISERKEKAKEEEK
tara:strand:+ start:265 stop:516 length:252 start_codon:yes stop_codon:yes gene_type:complete